jgi:O-antigen/teichoic acid export membrane protein
MGFPIGNALNLQGTVLAVGYALGPTAVVVFNTARTVSRVALQMVQMVNSTFEPEMTMAFGARNIELTRTLHRRAVQFALIVAVCIVACMMLFGPWFLSRWTGGHVPPSKGLLAILLVVVIFYTLWSTSSTLMTSTNHHLRPLLPVRALVRTPRSSHLTGHLRGHHEPLRPPRLPVDRPRHPAGLPRQHA